MHSNQILTLGLGLQEPWKIIGQTLGTDKQPHVLRLTVKADECIDEDPFSDLILELRKQGFISLFQ